MAGRRGTNGKGRGYGESESGLYACPCIQRERQRSLYQNGAVIISNKYVSASDEQIYVTVKGRGGHGCAPDECIDPIAAAVLIINNLQYIVSREVSPLNSSVIHDCNRQGRGTGPVILYPMRRNL